MFPKFILPFSYCFQKHALIGFLPSSCHAASRSIISSFEPQEFMSSTCIHLQVSLRCCLLCSRPSFRVSWRISFQQEAVFVVCATILGLKRKNFRFACNMGRRGIGEVSTLSTGSLELPRQFRSISTYWYSLSISWSALLQIVTLNIAMINQQFIFIAKCSLFHNLVLRK